MSLLGIDIGTTHIKAGLFRENGSLIKLSIQKNIVHRDQSGNSHYDPEEMWEITTRAIEEATSAHDETITAIGVTSMAESGLLLDRSTGKANSPIIPWFDRRTEEISATIGEAVDPFAQFQKTGLHNSYKHGLAKLLWLKGNGTAITENMVWLSTSDYIAYKLTGEIATDYTLAARTFAFQIDKKTWNSQLIEQFNLPDSVFPDALPSGKPVGNTSAGNVVEQGIPVAISGHDHVCTMLAAGVADPGVTLNSIGTAEALVGSISERELGEAEYQSGFNFGCHVIPGKYFWMGGIQSSGGSVEWLRDQFSDKEMISYEAMEQMIDQEDQTPTGILYYPYLAGSGSPVPDPYAKGAFIGLKASHGKGDLYKALLEGTAYELNYMKKAAMEMDLGEISRLISVGGGTNNKTWMQIKADVTNCNLAIPEISEVTLLGAALVAGRGCGVYGNTEEVLDIVRETRRKQVLPDEENHLRYRRIFEEGYLPLQQPLRNFYRTTR